MTPSKPKQWLRERPSRRLLSGRGAGSSALAVVLLLSLAGTALAQKYEGSCSAKECHGSLLAKPVKHAVIDGDSCDLCHEVDDENAHTFALTDEPGKLCTGCHDKFEKKHIHEPVSGGDCTICHDPHASRAKGLLITDTVGALCADCHDDVVEGLDHLHGPVSTGDCLICHDAHESEHSGLLTDAEPALCFGCHSEMQDSIGKYSEKHAPVADGCLLCHLPHGGDSKKFLSDAPRELCGGCHDDVTEKMDDSAHSHSKAGGERACLACHDAHGSDHAGMLAAQQDKLCGTCHGKPIEKQNGTVSPVSAQLAARPVKHGPVAEGECAICHTPHGSDARGMVSGAYPDSFYAPWDEDVYELCFMCHDAEAFEQAETEDATAFRDGARNLHYLHVHKDRKGRTCRACHEVHAGERPKLIAESVRFGKWDLPIGFTASEEGGTCQPGCHKPYSYDRALPEKDGADESADAKATPPDGQRPKRVLSPDRPANPQPDSPTKP